MVAAVLAFLLVTGFVLWYTSAGQFPSFPKIQNDYIDLGEAFLRGQLSLLEQPDPRLALLGDPYEYTQRKGIAYHWDASYFDGRYYLYWGPVPALVSAAVHAISGEPPPASLLVLLPFIGSMLVTTWLLVEIARDMGRHALRSVWLFVLIAFLNLPMLFTVGHPRHYQTSILFGQFFLLTGMLGLLQNMRGRGNAWLGLAGLSLGLAFASRYNLAISIAIYLASFALWLWFSRQVPILPRAIWLLAPLLLCLLGLGAYNQARFADPFETGMSYQLTITEFRQTPYALSYVPSGLYVYGLYPLTGSPQFPFIQSAHFTPRLLPDWLFVPETRDWDAVTFGLFSTVPAAWLLLLLIPVAIIALLGPRGRAETSADRRATWFVVGMLGAGALAQLIYLLVFFYVAERYIADFYLPLVLCIAALTWTAQARLGNSPLLQLGWWIILVLLMIWTAGIGYFSCFGTPTSVGLYYDPQMLKGQADFWNSLYAALQALLPL